ncbi:endonuclease domain-containing protein [Arthrobacter celericrescens]|uniref:endonuclease domain-containing protein n=1 Tax=Arthrobacter celericrescens TaxID=2320851 RepID=UPI000EA022C9|nr:hypothetical protein [Arthrobacter celericrescens]
MRLSELPGLFRTASFTTSEATAAGLSRSRLRAKDLAAPSRGIRAPDSELPGLLESLRGYTASDDQTVVSEITAAKAGGIPLPGWVDDRIHLSRTRGGTHPRRRGTVGHRTLLLPGEVIMVNGVRITSPARTWLDLSHHLPLYDLVAAGDYLVNRHGPDHPFPREPICTLDELRAVTMKHPKKKGKVQALSALDLIRPGADSPQETKMRLLLRDHGLPEPELNVVLFDDGGFPVLWPDAAYRSYRISLQYDGGVHGDELQYQKDIDRGARTARLGWTEVRISAKDLKGMRPPVVAKVREALRRTGER